MKNIYVVGAPRTGKTTLIKKIKEKYSNYNVISFEALRNGFIKTLPDLNMGNRESDARTKIMPGFIAEYATWNANITGFPSIIDYSVSIDLLINIIDKEDIIICLGHGLKTKKQIIDDIVKNSQKTDYTFGWTIDQLEKHFYDIEENDKKNYDYCKKYNLNYYDTSKNREDVINEIVSNLK